jgi:uncharacterized protein (DUF58 family)
MLRHRSLVMLLSDLLADPAPIRDALMRLRHGGHDVIIFHILDDAEIRFPFEGMVELDDPETNAKLVIDADAARDAYVKAVEEYREEYRSWCFRAGVDYVPLDTSMQFDRALVEYLNNRRARF